MNHNNTGISGTNNNKIINNRDEDIKFLIITNSVLTDKKEIYSALYDRGASIHYLIDKNGYQMQFANENDQTFTSGRSQFRENVSLNKSAVNIMFVNSGYEAYTQEQKDKFKAYLADFKQRNSGINLKTNLLGLGEVATLIKDAPSEAGKTFPRHEAPGKLFFWEELAGLGFGLFFSTSTEQKTEVCISPESSREEILALQQNLQKYGYAIEASGIYDEATKAWVTRFNQRYVPNNTNELDALWTQASKLSLEYILPFMPEKNAVHSQSALFRPASAPNTDVVVEQQVAQLNLR